MKIKLIAVLLISIFSANIYAQLPVDRSYDIWPSIPFLRGADLCKYKDAYGQTRTEYMEKMVKLAKELLQEKAKAQEALQLLMAFNEMYDRNQSVAMNSGSMEVTLESTLKSYLDQLYRQVMPREKRLSFTNLNDMVEVIQVSKAGMRDGYLTKKMVSRLDFVAYGSYSLAPNCRGDIEVTIHLVGRNGKLESFVANGTPDTVMFEIAKQMFEKFQRTEFPSKIKIGKNVLTLIGGLNGSVDITDSAELAELNCESMDARLPTKLELEVINGYGDWSGGVSFNNRTFVLPDGKVYVSRFKSSPVRHLDTATSVSEVNEREFNYYCVK